MHDRLGRGGGGCDGDGVLNQKKVCSSKISSFEGKNFQKMYMNLLIAWKFNYL
jgi:hypothetical protein